MNSHEPFLKKSENGKEKINEIITLNDNGDFLIESLNLKNLKTTKKHPLDERTRVLNNTGTFSPSVERLMRAKIDELQFEQYKKYPLIDIGTNGKSRISIFAQNIEVPGVIAVDIARQIDEGRFKELKETAEYKNKQFPVVGLKIDMLDLLRQIPDGTCNVSFFSIDSFVVQSNEYRKDMITELLRVVPKDGLIISESSFVDNHIPNDRILISIEDYLNG